MGTWGAKPFENDGVADWVLEAIEPMAAGAIDDALRPAADSEPDEPVDSWAGELAMAAAEIVAALNGHPADDLPWQVERYVARGIQEPSDELTRTAGLAVRRTLAANSELAEMYDEAASDTDAEWRAAAADLLSRLERPRTRSGPGIRRRIRVARRQLSEQLLRRRFGAG